MQVKQEEKCVLALPSASIRGLHKQSSRVMFGTLTLSTLLWSCLSSLAHAVVVKVPSTTWKDRNFVFLARFVFKPNVNSAEIVFRHVAKTDDGAELSAQPVQ